MYNTRYLPENVEQCRLEKTILRHFPYNLNVRSRCIALIQDGGKNMKALIAKCARRLQQKTCSYETGLAIDQHPQCETTSISFIDKLNY